MPSPHRAGPGTLVFPLLAALGPFAWRVWDLGTNPEHFGRTQDLFSIAALVVAPAIALVVARWRPEWSGRAALAATVAVLNLYGLPLGSRLAMMTVVPTALWALALGTIEPAWPPLRDPRPFRLALPLVVVGETYVVRSLSENRPVQFMVAALVVALATMTPGVRAKALSVHDRLAAPMTPWAAIWRAVASVPDRILDFVLAGARRWAAPSPRSDHPDAPGDPGEAGARSSLRAEILPPALAWAAITFLMSKVQLVAFAYGGRHDLDVWDLLPRVTQVEGRLGWGSGDYWRIADHGYRIDEHLEAAFPGYALVVRWLAAATGLDLTAAEVVVSSVSGLLATVLVWRLARVRGLSPRQQRVALALFLSYPYCFMLFGIAYNDPFLLPLVLGAWLFIESGRPVVAGLVGAAATFTRPNALPLILGLTAHQVAIRGAVEARWPRRLPPGRDGATGPPLHAALAWVRSVRVHPRRLRVRDAGVLLSLGGVGIFSYWMWRHSGDPLYFVTVQEHYSHRPATELSTWFKVDFFNRPMSFIDHLGEALNHLLAAGVLLIAVVALPRLVHRLGWGYGLFALGVLAISWVGPNGFAPAGRYLLPALPLYVVVGAEVLEDRPRILVPAVVLGAVISVVFTVVFSRTGTWLEW